MRTECDNCFQKITLTIWEDEFVGEECSCGYYVTRYTNEFRQESDWL